MRSSTPLQAAAIARLEVLEHQVARALIRLAGRAPRWLRERVQRELDGARLHPELELLLVVKGLIGGSRIGADDPKVARARLKRDARVHAGAPEQVAAVRDLTFDGPGGPLRARHYTPFAKGRRPRPLLVFFHGGGFVTGDLDTHDPPCRVLCRALDVHVLAIDYRLAPEHPFPAAVEDARAALRFAQASATSLGADPARIGVAGDSAGGNLATVATQLAVQAGEPPPVVQLLFYPTVDSTVDRPSMELFGEGFFLTRADIAWFRKQYVPQGNFADPRVSPLLGRLAGLPPAVIVTAGFDPLRDEGEAYVEALRAAGSEAVLYRVPDLIHGFLNLGSLSRASQEAVLHVAGLARDLLESPRAPDPQRSTRA